MRFHSVNIPSEAVPSHHQIAFFKCFKDPRCCLAQLPPSLPNPVMHGIDFLIKLYSLYPSFPATHRLSLSHKDQTAREGSGWNQSEATETCRFSTITSSQRRTPPLFTAVGRMEEAHPGSSCICFMDCNTWISQVPSHFWLIYCGRGFFPLIYLLQLPDWIT